MITIRGTTMKMKAALYKDKLQAEVTEIDIPEIGPNDVLVKTVRSSICGSDTGGVGVFPGKEFGHETAGYVVKIGSDVKDFQEGDRVFVEPRRSMPSAFETCMLGGFSEYIRILNAKKNSSLWPLADSITWDQASLIEPFGVGTRGKNRPNAQVGDNVVVYGAGSIGLFCISALKAQGITPVVVDIALSDYKLALLDKIGAVVAPLDETKFDFLREHFGELPKRNSGTALNVDIVIDCAGAPVIFNDFQTHFGKAGCRLVTLGVIMKPVEIVPAFMMSTETLIMGSSGYDDADIAEVIDNLASGRTYVEEIITHHYPLEQINEALKMAANREEAIKVVIDME